MPPALTEPFDRPRATKPGPATVALERFDTLPDSAHVRLPTVCGLQGISPATVWRWVREGRLPRPHRLGPQVTAWNVGELRAALARVA